MKEWCGEILGDLEPVYNLLLITSDVSLLEAVTQACMWRLCEAGCFSYSESLQTPPLDGPSLHPRNNVERP